MKKLLLLLAIIFTLLTSAKAQFFLGGNISAYKYPKSHGVKYTYVSFSPSVGYQYNRWAFGMSFNYQKVTGIYHSHTYGSADAFTYEPFAQFEIIRKDRVAFITDLTFSYTRCDGERYHFIGITPGIRYNLTKHLMADVYLGVIGYSDDFFYGNKGFICSLSLNTATFSLYYRFTK